MALRLYNSCRALGWGGRGFWGLQLRLSALVGTDLRI